MRTFLVGKVGFVEKKEWEPNCWINVVAPTREDLRFLTDEMGVPEEFIDDIEDVDERSRLEIEDGWTLMIMRIPYKSVDTSIPFITVPLGIIIKDEVFVTVCYHHTEMLPDFINFVIRKNLELANNWDLVFRLFLSSSVWYLKYLKQVNAQMHMAEVELERSIRNEELQRLLKIEKSLVFFITSLRGNDNLLMKMKTLRSQRQFFDDDLVEDVEIELRQAQDSARIYSDINREKMIELVRTIHERHRTHGYRWTAAYIRVNENIEVCNNYVYKCFRYLGIKSETKHQIHYRPRKIKDRYPNLIYSTWETVDRPRQVIVSDMTAFKVWYMYIEVTFYFDVFTKEILSYKVAERRGAREQYIDGLNDVITLLKGVKDPVILHTDQGTVYASMAYNELIKDTNIIRSMSRAGKPTDNPVNEALNGWIKEELVIDFKIEECREKKAFEEVMEKYVKFYNEQRPCFAIGYDTSENYRKRYDKGEIKCKETFEKREVSTEPKFVQERRSEKLSMSILSYASTFEKENEERL